MLKDTKSLGNNKASACESRDFVHKKEGGVHFDTPPFSCQYSRTYSGTLGGKERRGFHRQGGGVLRRKRGRNPRKTAAKRLKDIRLAF